MTRNRPRRKPVHAAPIPTVCSSCGKNSTESVRQYREHVETEIRLLRSEAKLTRAALSICERALSALAASGLLDDRAVAAKALRDVDAITAAWTRGKEGA